MTYDLSFTSYYQIIRPLVWQIRHQYPIKLWNKEDWEQEGMLMLHQMICQEPDVLQDITSLETYFISRFSYYVQNEWKKQLCSRLLV